ncbi:MAG: chemotaxis protein CheX [Gammaproteobacteria bacterium]|nr:chemotaxis protein CheX [Gammaproteobacteria bacterium]
MDSFNARYLTFCKPYIDATQTVYSTMVQTELKTTKAHYKSDLKFNYDYSAIIGNSGDYTRVNPHLSFKSTLIISWPKESYIKTANKMLMEAYEEYNKEISDVGMEICNIVTGAAKGVLYELGFEIRMAIPTSIWGANHSFGGQNASKTIVMPMKSELGTVYIQLFYAEND